VLAAGVWLADRRGAFARDAFTTPTRKRLALLLLLGVLVTTTILPAAGGAAIDTSKVRFSEVFFLQGALAVFLLGWWFLAGRPSLRNFLALASERPLAEAATGVALGLIGWVLTLVLALAVALLAGGLGLRGPHGVPPLVGWIASLPAPKRLLIVACAMTVEEFHFRAFLQRRVGAVPASALFVLSHGGYGEPFLLVGLLAITTVLALAFRKTGSAWAPIFAHGTFDGIQLFIFLPAALKLLTGK
jgi:membrane protease YdiL (CAAX protease family)